MKRTFGLLGLLAVGLVLLLNPFTGIPATLDAEPPAEQVAMGQATGAPPFDEPGTSPTPVPNPVTTTVPAPGPSTTSPNAPTSTAATPSPEPSTTTQSSNADATFVGSSVSTRFGPFQVQVTLRDGTIVDVATVRQPSSSHSRAINRIVLPYYEQWAQDAQSSNIDSITGATITWQAFRRSLDSALSEATS